MAAACDTENIGNKIIALKLALKSIILCINFPAYPTDFIRKFSRVFLDTSDAEPLGVENAACL